MAPYVEELAEQIDCTIAAKAEMLVNKYWLEHVAEGNPDTFPAFCEYHGYDYRDGKAWTWSNPVGFWDWFKIGGRWNNKHIEGQPRERESQLCYNDDHSQKFTPSTHPEQMPYTLVTGEGPIHKETYVPNEEPCFRETPNWDERVGKVLEVLQPEQSIFIVDYHT